MGQRKKVRCAHCGSLERTRAIGLFLDHFQMPGPDAKIFHMAPERGLAAFLRAKDPAHYDAVDIDPSRYPHTQVRPFDAVTDCAGLPSDYYDLIIHSHGLEHIPCSIAYVLFHLTRALKPGGLHLFCIPILKGHYSEDFAPLSDEEATARFGQFDHLRRFSRDDIDQHLGQIIRIDKNYSLYDTFDKNVLDDANIPENERTGLKGSTIFIARKEDYLLQ
ncbi:MAG: methyltransferase domain-containing protein [Pseudomonadota bacterium]